MFELIKINPEIFEIKDKNGKVKFSSDGNYLKRHTNGVEVTNSGMDFGAFPASDFDKTWITNVGATVHRVALFGGSPTVTIMPPNYGTVYVSCGRAYYTAAYSSNYQWVYTKKSAQTYRIEVTKYRADGSYYVYVAGYISASTEHGTTTTPFPGIPGPYWEFRRVYGGGPTNIALSGNDSLRIVQSDTLNDNYGDAMYGTQGNAINSGLLKWLPIFMHSPDVKFGWVWDDT